MRANPSYTHARVSQRSESTVMFSQPTFEEREHAFLVNPAIAPGALYTVSSEIAEPSSLRTTYDLVGNQARAHQAPSYSTWYGLVGNEARASHAPSYSTRYGLVGNEARTSQAPSYSTQYDLVDNETRNSQARSYSPPYGLVSKEARTSSPPPLSSTAALVVVLNTQLPPSDYSTRPQTGNLVIHLVCQLSDTVKPLQVTFGIRRNPSTRSPTPLRGIDNVMGWRVGPTY